MAIEIQDIYIINLKTLRTLTGDNSLFIVTVKLGSIDFFEYIANTRDEVILMAQKLYKLLNQTTGSDVRLIDDATGARIKIQQLNSWAFKRLGW